jgi:hypothetical protein
MNKKRKRFTVNMARRKQRKIRNIDEVYGGYGPEQLGLLRRVYEGLELIDAVVNYPLMLREEDYKGAIPNDLENCVFANTGKRQYNSGKVVFMGEVAYFDVEDEDGVRRVNRVLTSKKLQKAVRAYDESKGKILPKPGTYMLSAPPPSRTLDSIRAYDKTWKERNPEKHAVRLKIKIEREKTRQALIKATGKPAFKKTKNLANPLGIIRSGTGLVQTKVVKKKAA